MTGEKKAGGAGGAGEAGGEKYNAHSALSTQHGLNAPLPLTALPTHNLERIRSGLPVGIEAINFCVYASLGSR